MPSSSSLPVSESSRLVSQSVQPLLVRSKADIPSEGRTDPRARFARLHPRCQAAHRCLQQDGHLQVVRGPIQRDRQGDQGLHQEGWIQPSIRSLRPHLWMARYVFSPLLCATLTYKVTTCLFVTSSLLLYFTDPSRKPLPTWDGTKVNRKPLDAETVLIIQDGPRRPRPEPPRVSPSSMPLTLSTPLPDLPTSLSDFLSRMFTRSVSFLILFFQA